MLAAAIRNTFIAKKNDAISPADCMPDWTARPDDDEEGEVVPDGADS